jgi:hypothetical protein
MAALLFFFILSRSAALKNPQKTVRMSEKKCIFAAGRLRERAAPQQFKQV